MIPTMLESWVRGGWVMLPLVAVSLAMFVVGLRLVLRMRRLPDRWGSDGDWQSWVRDTSSAPPEVRTLLLETGMHRTSVPQLHRSFAGLNRAWLAPLDRQLALLSTLVAAAPLVGLLGTVSGMLVTFRALALGGGGQITEAMAAGISQALFPPEIGLCIALPGLVIAHWCRRRRHEFEAFLVRLESLGTRQIRSRTTARPVQTLSREQAWVRPEALVELSV